MRRRPSTFSAHPLSTTGRPARARIALVILPVLSACSSSTTPDPSGAASAQAPSVPATAPLAPSATATVSASSPTTAAPPADPPPAPTVDPRIGAGPADVDEVVPGVSIGPVKLGMTLDELKALKLWVRPFDRAERDPHTFLVGPHYVVLDGGRVSSIESTVTQMPKGLRIRGRVLPWRTRFVDVAEAFEGCEPMVKGLCGDWFRCEGKRLYVKGGCGAGVVHVQIFAEPRIEPWEKDDAGP